MNIVQKIDTYLNNISESSYITYDIIKMLCPKAVKISESSGYYFFRGTDDLHDKFGKATIRENRKPLNSPQDMHSLFDKAFKRVFGINLRSRSLFCTGNSDDARGYGTIYKIYPSDDFKVYGSPNIGDFTELRYARMPGLPLSYKLIAMFIDPGLIRNTDFTITLRADTRYQKMIQFVFPEYVAKHKDSKDPGVNVWRDMGNDSSDTLKRLLRAYPDCAEKFVKANYKKAVSESDVVSALKSFNELMVTASFYCYEKDE